MNIINDADAFADLEKVLDRVVEDHSPTMIIRDDGDPVVLVSLADWNMMEHRTGGQGHPYEAQAAPSL